MLEEKLRDVGGKGGVRGGEMWWRCLALHHPVQAEWTGVRGRLPPRLGLGKMPGRGIAATSRLQSRAV